MAQVDRLGALQVRVAGHRPVGVALGELQQPLHQRADQPPGQRRRARARTARGRSPPGRCASGRCGACRRAGRRSRSAAARSPCGCPRRRPRTGTSRPRARPRPCRGPRSIAPSSSVVEDLRRTQGARVRPRLLDVVRAPGAGRSRSTRSAARTAGRADRESATCGVQVVLKRRIRAWRSSAG